ncbi:hypothetical protein OB13_00750 [Pontibacter sp. HJ8]
MKNRLPFWVGYILCLLCVTAEAQKPTEEWARRYNGIGSHNERSSAIAVDAAGNSYITGTTTRTYNNDFYYSIVTVKYSPTGEMLWEKVYDEEQPSRAAAIAVDNQGGVYVTGNTGIYINDYDMITIRYDAVTSEENWVRQFNGEINGADEAVAIATDNRGGVYVTGLSANIEPISNISNIATIRYEATTGAISWIRYYDGPTGGHDEPTALALDDQGGIYITGFTFLDENNANFTTIRYNTDTGKESWVKHYNGPANSFDFAQAIAVDKAGGVYVTGYSSGKDTGYDYTTIRYHAATGQEAWVQRYNGEGSESADFANAIAVDNMGGVYVTGNSGKTNYNYATIRYDAASGTQAWAMRYDGAANGHDIPAAIAADDRGGVYVTGYSLGSTSDFDYTTIRYEAASGQQGWTSHYNGEGNGYDEASAMAMDDNGGLYVTGYSFGGSTGGDLATVRYEATTGQASWVSRQDVQGSLSDVSIAVAVDAAGNSYVTGTSRYDLDDEDFMSRSGIVTIKYSPAGEELWVKVYQQAQNNRASAIAIDNQGGVYVTGYSYSNNTPADYVTIRYEAATGEENWVQRYNGESNKADQPEAIALDNKGGVYVTGSSVGNGKNNSDYATVRYEAATGAQTWVQRYNGPAGGIDRATGMVIDEQDGIYVTGYSQGENSSYDFATIRYSAASGAQDWVQRYGGKGESYDVARAIAMDQEGIYVTGYSYDWTTGIEDFLTVRHDATTGEVSWTGIYKGKGQGTNQANAIAVDSSGGVYVTGASWSDTSGSDFATLRYDAATGQESWVQRYSSEGNETDWPRAIAVDQAGSVYVTGYSTRGSSTVFNTIKYNSANGTPLWDIQTTGYDAAAVDMALDLSGSIIVTGYSRGTATALDMLTVKYNQQSECPALTEAAVSGSSTAAVRTRGSVYALTTDATSFTWSITDGKGAVYTDFSGQGTKAIAVNWPSTSQVYKLSVTYGGTQGCPVSTATRYVHVFDTEAGFLTGGGWLRSPAHPDYEFMQTSSRAYFGLMARYKKGEENPLQGEMQLLVENGSFYFRGSLQQARTLVIAGNQAFYRGQGKVTYRDSAGKFINDSRTFGFLVAATDGNFGKAREEDQLRIQVWEIRPDGTRGAVVYDNQAACSTNLDDNVTACQAISSGTITIHTPNIQSAQNSKPLAAESLPAATGLAAYPTAFSDRTTLAFSVDQDTDYTLELFDLKGALVRRLAAGTAETGKRYEHQLPAADMGSGMYLVRLSAGSTVQTIKIMVEK